MTEATASSGGITKELEGFLVAATDAVTDDMVSRFAETIGEGVALLDSINRSGVSKALPVLARMVETGDLERLSHFARVLGAMEDAVTDDMVSRFAELAADWVTVLDRLNRSGVGKLVDVLDRLNNLGALDRMVANLNAVDKLVCCLGDAAQEAHAVAPPRGGIMQMLRVASTAENQQAIAFALGLSRRIQRQFG